MVPKLLRTAGGRDCSTRARSSSTAPNFEFIEGVAKPGTGDPPGVTRGVPIPLREVAVESEVRGVGGLESAPSARIAPGRGLLSGVNRLVDNRGGVCCGESTDDSDMLLAVTDGTVAADLSCPARENNSIAV